MCMKVAAERKPKLSKAEQPIRIWKILLEDDTSPYFKVMYHPYTTIKANGRITLRMPDYHVGYKWSSLFAREWSVFTGLHAFTSLQAARDYCSSRFNKYGNVGMTTNGFGHCVPNTKVKIVEMEIPKGASYIKGTRRLTKGVYEDSGEIVSSQIKMHDLTATCWMTA